MNTDNTKVGHSSRKRGEPHKHAVGKSAPKPETKARHKAKSRNHGNKRTKAATRAPTHEKSSKYQWLNQKYGRLRARDWLFIGGLALAALCVGGWFLVRREVPDFRPAHQFAVRDPFFFSAAHAAADPVPVEGNRITLLHNGKGTFPQILQSIAGSKATINFEAFIFNSGQVGDQFIEALVARARAGVEVRILLDGIGSGLSLKNSDVRRLEEGGCTFAYYHPTRAFRLDRLNRRTHRRVIVIDGRVGFTGGIGFSDEWQGNADSPDHWRDLHAKVEGPVVAKLQAAFQQHWFAATGEMLATPSHFPLVETAGKLRAQVITSTEFSLAALPLMQAVAIASAEKTIDITNPYCTPTEGHVYLLNEAVKRGVRVRMLLPGKHNDQPWTKAAGRTCYGELLKGGVQIFEYTPTMIHSKTMVVDGLFSILGTSNLDARSAAINEEIDLTVYDQDFAKQMEGIFEDDMKHTSPYTLESFERRGLWERFSEWIVLPFQSQL
ncbi:phospholipase D-like domain-containing protein [Prosthecobacter sp.]|uniref:phospholipase D-like domain-containing protein n=1 Tax=Prosthecobacter sp. TaxID=1965333 RepID=UPI0024898117|nr:phospholipase D-like domain-containing protein [Prosthecobacter sp.]MDI1314576.1 phospholipase D-like domain-containing protein [Prosthecobacter sp.]